MVNKTELCTLATSANNIDNKQSYAATTTIIYTDQTVAVHKRITETASQKSKGDGRTEITINASDQWALVFNHNCFYLFCHRNDLY
ncbi:hypothetical protein ACRASX_06435 [Flavobacterium sp. TMP13]|uniref:hypothetical protein n=1 Tax=Flavobacterium sp. TMP13 TaxID=3425950 RepID=UPI003D77E889